LKWRRERESHEDAEADDYLLEWDKPQKIRLARRGNLGEGNLYVGRIADSEQFHDGLVLHTGHEPVPNNLETNNNVVVHRLILSDGSNRVEDWLSWIPLVKLGAEAIKNGIPVLATCDAGCSRSVTTASAIVALVEQVPLEMCTIGRELRNRFWDGTGEGEFLPNPTLFAQARIALDVLRGVDTEGNE
jgi:hypothetical protein